MKLLSFIMFLALISTPQEAKVKIMEEFQKTPETALKLLLEGNKRFVEDKLACPDRHQERRAATVAAQRPFAIVLGCSDSRVPPELIFDLGIGDVFVVRVAGNIAADTELDSILYSALFNNSSIIVVLGHENCGAVTAVLANNTIDIEAIAKHIEPAIQKAKDMPGDPLVNAIRLNVAESVRRIKSSSPIAKLIQEGKIAVVGAYYHLKSGKVELL